MSRRFLFAMRSAYTPPPPDVPDPPSPFLIRTTEKKFISLAENLETCPDENPITVTVTGPVNFLVWLHRPCVSGETRTYYKNWLLDEMMAAETVGATEGVAAASWSISFKTGANNTGSTTTITRSFTVSNTPILEWDFGRNTFCRRGGVYLPTALNSGTVDSWQVTNQEVPSLFEVFGGRLVRKAVAGTANNAYGSHAYTGTIDVNRPYWVDVSNGSTSYRLSITFVTSPSGGRRWDLAPYPRTGINAMSDVITNEQLWDAARNISTCNFGDEFVLEDGTFNPQSLTSPGDIALGSEPTQRVDGPAAPTDCTEFASADGWVTFRGRNFQAATVNRLTLRFGKRVQAYMRFTNLRNAWLNIFVTVGSLRLEWLQVDHCTMTTFSTTSPAGGCYNIHLLRNDFNGGGTGSSAVSCFSADCNIIGNRIRGYAGDGLKIAPWMKSRMPRIWWNFVFDKKYVIGSGTHADYGQFVYNVGPTYDYIPELEAGGPQDFTIASVIGNVAVRGVGTKTSGGVDEEDGQGIPFIHDLGNGYRGKLLALGNINSVQLLAGMMLNAAAPGSKIENNTIIPDYSSNWPNGTTPKLRLQDKVSAPVAVNGNLFAANPGYTLEEAPNNPGGTAPAVSSYTGNVHLTGLTDAQAQLVNPLMNDGGVLYIEDVVARMTPKAGSAAALALAGAVGSGRVDHLRETFDETFLS